MQSTPTPETSDNGSQYRKMVLAAIATQPGSDVGAVLTCEYSEGGYSFFMWTGSHPVGRKLHTLLASVTPQERLDAHWQGFVANVARGVTESGSGISDNP
jgi:hypothetical protein